MFRCVKLCAYAALSVAVLAGFSARAHKPLPFEGSYGDANEALYVEHIDVSQVIYYELSAKQPQLWLTFDKEAEQDLYLSLGVPVIERLAGYRPAVAVLGPGLPKAPLPFAIPEGFGALVFDTSDDASPEEFHEPVTGTDSWVLFKQTVALPGSGRHYVVAYSPTGKPEKLWVAIGLREAFGMGDVIGLPATVRRVRAFHELAGQPRWLTISAGIGLTLVGLAFVWLFAR